jgi:hypothetical protein
MSPDLEYRLTHRRRDSLGHLRRVHLVTRVNARHDHIKLFEHRIGIVEPPLATMSDSVPRRILIDTFSCTSSISSHCRFNLSTLQTVRITRGRRMIRNRDVLHAHLFSAAHHRFETVYAVGISRVAMDHAFDVCFGDQILGQLSSRGPLRSRLRLRAAPAVCKPCRDGL